MKPTDGEIEILQVVWQEKEPTIRQVHDVLFKKRGVAYTTVATMMQLMVKKGLLEVADSQRPSTYRASKDMDATRDQLLKGIAQQMFGGSVKSLVLHLLSRKKSTPAQIKKAKDLLKDID